MASGGMVYVLVVLICPFNYEDIASLIIGVLVYDYRNNYLCR